MGDKVCTCVSVLGIQDVSKKEETQIAQMDLIFVFIDSIFVFIALYIILYRH